MTATATSASATQNIEMTQADIENLGDLGGVVATYTANLIDYDNGFATIVERPAQGFSVVGLTLMTRWRRSTTRAFVLMRKVACSSL